MLRFIRNLSIILFVCTVQTAVAANHYQKSGAPVSLSKAAYHLDNNNTEQAILIALSSNAIGTMQLSFSSSGATSIKNNSAISVAVTSVSQTQLIPLTVKAPINSKSYLNIFVTFTDHHGAVTSRALSARLISGQPPSLKPSGTPPSVISMRAVETINGSR